MAPPMSAPTTSYPPAPPRPLLLALAYLAFVSLGLPDAVLGVSWPSIRHTFELPQAGMGIILATGAASYFVSGLLVGRLMRALGVGLLLVASTVLVTLGITGYATLPYFPLFLMASCVIGFGSGAIDAGLNTYAAQHFGARHMNWLHAAYSTGAALGPVLTTALLARDAGWRAGYAVIAALLGTLALCFVLMRRQWDGAPGGSASTSNEPGGAGDVTPTVGALEALRRAPVGLQILIFFFYTGIEVTAGQWSYTLLTEERGLGTAEAGTWVSVFWGCLLAGRISLGFVIERVGTVRLLRLSTALAVVGALLFALPSLPPALGLGLLGFSISSIFPALMSETPRRVGQDAAAHAVGFQVSAATLGIAVLPSLAGLLGARFGLWVIGWQILGCVVLLTVLHEILSVLTDRASAPASREVMTRPVSQEK
ncbi:MFS transporter [Cystobacter fuscus]|nr:MFS transporter [Cystobacter fuscus]